MNKWLFQYFSSIIPGIDKPEDMPVERLDGALVSLFKVTLPSLALLDEHPRFLKTMQGVVAAAGRNENRRYILELETREEA